MFDRKRSRVVLEDAVIRVGKSTNCLRPKPLAIERKLIVAGWTLITVG